MNLSKKDLLGPFLHNSTIICFNNSLLPEWAHMKSSPSNISLQSYDTTQLEEAIVPCDSPEYHQPMNTYLLIFWNLMFSLMIFVAIIGNSMVLIIVISEYKCQKCWNKTNQDINLGLFSGKFCWCFLVIVFSSCYCLVMLLLLSGTLLGGLDQLQLILVVGDTKFTIVGQSD